MTTANGACIGPEHALNVHRDCPGCSCWCHRESAQNPLEIRGNAAPECENGGTAKGRIALTNPTLLATVSTRPKGA